MMISDKQYNSPRRVLAMVVVVAGWLAGGVVMTQATFPFPRAAVCTDADTYIGRLVGSSGEDVFLGDRHRIRAIPRDRLREVDVGLRASACAATPHR